MFSTKTFHTGELSLSYAEGPDNGPPILLLHGLLGRWQWTEQAARPLSKEWHVYTCDLRGHGESGRAPSPGGYLLDDYVRDIVAFIREEIPDGIRVPIIGFSLGALVALGTAGVLPERVSGIILVEPPLMIRNHRFSEMPIASLFETAYEVTRKTSARDELIATARAAMPGEDEDWIEEIANQLGKIDPEVTNPELLDRLLHGLDLTTTLEVFHGPIMLMHGEPALGSLVQQEDVTWMRDHATKVEIIPIAGVGHGAPMDFVLEHGLNFLEPLR